MDAIAFRNPLPDRLRIVEPFDYLDTLRLQKGARLVMTDSGGMQEETTYLDVPCITLRANTERPVTVSDGTSELVGNDVGKIQAAFERAVAGIWKHSRPIPYWDGHTAERIVDIIARGTLPIGLAGG
jgi:UDP-N-acetylglucosamine 2-epimerase (non-hydrolysing)